MAQKVALLGLGRSNMALGRFLLEKGAKVTALDQKEAAVLGERARVAGEMGMELVLGPDYLDHLSGFDTIYLTPGIKKSLPQIRDAENAGTILSSEINLVFDVCRGTIIGITGSAGKTTTVSLVGEILKREGRWPVYIGGNIGTPLIEIAENIERDAMVVLELSSFQLQLLRKSPHISAVLNISQNHLDIHDSMDEYVDSKKNIYRFAAARDWAVFNSADEETIKMADEARHLCNVATFSRHGMPGQGAYLEDGLIKFVREGVVSDCGPVSSRLIPGDHNIDNILAATCVAMLAGVGPEAVKNTVSVFPGVEHRLELVTTVNGVRYYNDSIATAPDRTMAAIDTVHGELVLILGGYDKGISFDALAAHLLPRVKTVVLMGAAAPPIEAAIIAAVAKKGVQGPEIIRVTGFEQAVSAASRAAQEGGAVLLSPACASFDMFTDFEERGKRFKQQVMAL